MRALVKVKSKIKHRSLHSFKKSKKSACLLHQADANVLRYRSSTPLALCFAKDAVDSCVN
jgi:hypothetical protein